MDPLIYQQLAAETLIDVPEARVDDWCEDRAPAELTDDDGTD